MAFTSDSEIRLLHVKGLYYNQYGVTTYFVMKHDKRPTGDSDGRKIDRIPLLALGACFRPPPIALRVNQGVNFADQCYESLGILLVLGLLAERF